MTYNEFIQNIINIRGQWNIPSNEYYEAHHIVLRSLGGLPDIKNPHGIKHKNIIWLYPHEHFIAHKLLAEENPHNWQIVNAFHCMACMEAGTNIRYISPDEYKMAKQLVAECIKSSYPYTIECIDTGELYRCPSDAAKAKNILPNHIAECCKGKRNSAGGIHWRYFNCTDFANKNNKQYIKDMGPIKCLETNTVYKKVADFTEDYAKQYSIINCCKGNICTAAGYHWELLNTNYNKRLDKRYGRKIICIETGICYNCIADAVKLTGIKNIKLVVYCKRKTAGGYHWKYFQ